MNANQDQRTWNLRLYIAGDSAKSQAALRNLRRLCERHLPGRHSIEVIDLVESPELAKAHQILAIPTLVRQIPEPIKRVIGDLSDESKALLNLDLNALDDGPELGSPSHLPLAASDLAEGDRKS